MVGGRVCVIANDVTTPSASVPISGRSVLTPAVSSQIFDQAVRSRPLVASSSTRRSVSSVLPHACLRKYAETPLMNSSRPTQATSCLSTEAPLA